MQTPATVPQLPPFKAIEPDYAMWHHHLAKAQAENIAVLSSAIKRPGAWLLKVAGSSGDTYAVRVRPDGDGAAFEASCSCRAGQRGQYRCKHVAVALESLALLPSRSAGIWAEGELILSGHPF